MKILIVDDSKAMRMIVARILRQAGFTDHTISEAANGVEAFKAISETAPDLVLSDWDMPEMNGIELLEKVVAAKLRVKFGFVTSASSPEMRARASDAGALFLIAKPFTAKTFEGVLSEYLS